MYHFPIICLLAPKEGCTGLRVMANNAHVPEKLPMISATLFLRKTLKLALKGSLSPTLLQEVFSGASELI